MYAMSVPKLVLVLFLSQMIMGNPLSSQNLSSEGPIRFLALGDSYTIGESVEPSENWPHQLYSKLAQLGYQTDSLCIIAKTGWRTDQLIEALEMQNPQDFNLTSLLIGVNNQYQGRPASEMKSDFKLLIDKAIQLNGGFKHRLLVISIPDYAYTPFGQKKDPVKISTELDDYNSWQKNFCEKAGILYFDITPISRNGLENPELVADDGLHPSSRQYELWVKLILKQWMESTRN